MKGFKLTTLSVDARVDDAIRKSMEIYCNKLVNKNIAVGLEATFQHELALILRDVLDLKTMKPNERFSITLEQNIPVGGEKNYVDIVIHYDEDGKDKTDYLVELKFKKKTDSAPDLGTIETYFDFYNLDRLCNTSLNPGNIKKAYEIFLTDLQTYHNHPRSGTRTELPMYDRARVLKNQKYMVSGGTATKNVRKKYGPNFNGFSFTKNFDIEYTVFKMNDNDFWYFIVAF